jgi:SAM-dependent methyltransferase
MDRIIFDRMAELDQEHWWYVARREILSEVILRYSRPDPHARILEIGCGTGHNLPMLAQFGLLDACELDDEARQLATQRLGRPVRESRLPDLSAFEPASYDFIALLDVLEHVEEDKSALHAVRQLLKPGGKLLLTVPANKWMWSGHDVAHHHFRRYSRSDLKRLVQGTDFRVRLLSYFNTLLFPPIAAVRAANKLLKRVEADDALPSAVVNRLLQKLFSIEKNLVGRLPMPFGVSLVAVLER